MKGLSAIVIRAMLPAILAVLGMGGCGSDRLLPPEEPVSPPLPAAARIFFTQYDVARPNAPRVVSMRPDGSDRRVVADLGYLSSPPAHGLIAYVTPKNYGSVYVASLDGSDPRRLYTATGDTDAILTGVGLSPTGTKVAFGTRGVLHVVDVADGDAFTIVEPNEDPYSPGHIDSSLILTGTPRFSPDGTHLVYYRHSWRLSDGLRYVNVATESREPDRDSSFQGLADTAISWSPDGAKAYLGASWSPDGKFVAFTREVIDVGEKLLIDTAYATKSGAIPVPSDASYDERYEFNPHWSADGSRILFLGASDRSAGVSVGRILVYDVATDHTDVIDPSGTAINAYWSLGQ